MAARSAKGGGRREGRRERRHRAGRASLGGRQKGRRRWLPPRAEPARERSAGQAAHPASSSSSSSPPPFAPPGKMAAAQREAGGKGGKGGGRPRPRLPEISSAPSWLELSSFLVTLAAGADMLREEGARSLASPQTGLARPPRSCRRRRALPGSRSPALGRAPPAGPQGRASTEAAVGGRARVASRDDRRRRRLLRLLQARGERCAGAEKCFLSSPSRGRQQTEGAHGDCAEQGPTRPLLPPPETRRRRGGLSRTLGDGEGGTAHARSASSPRRAKARGGARRRVRGL